MTDDTDPTVNHGQENRPGGREEQNHGAVKNGLSGPQDSPRLHQAQSPQGFEPDQAPNWFTQPVHKPSLAGFSNPHAATVSAPGNWFTQLVHNRPNPGRSVQGRSVPLLASGGDGASSEIR